MARSPSLWLLAAMLVACTPRPAVVVVVDAADFQVGDHRFASTGQVVAALGSNPDHGRVVVTPGTGVDFQGARFADTVSAIRLNGIEVSTIVVGNEVFTK